MRERVLLALFRGAGRAVRPTELMAWASRVGEREELREALPYYDFLRHEGELLSFTLEHELGRLETRGLLRNDARGLSLASDEAATIDALISTLPAVARAPVDVVLGRAVDSEPQQTPQDPPSSEPAPPAIYTTGYEGLSIERFLARLIRARLRRVIDVRQNAYSRKYGFTGATLAELCARVSVEHVHVPALGVPSRLRADLSTQAARDALFARYEREMLPKEGAAIARVTALLRDAPSALLCFEAKPEDCHRARLAPALFEATGLPIVHL